MFSEQNENLLADYILKAADIYYGLSPKEVRTLAYEYANKLNLSIPESWVDKQIAGVDWFASFMKRHPRLSLRATGLARASAFNKTNVDLFFTKLKTVIDRLKTSACDNWNVDETGITAHKPKRVIARRDFKLHIRRITA